MLFPFVCVTVCFVFWCLCQTQYRKASELCTWLDILGHYVLEPSDLKHDYTLSEEFRRNHFLVGLLLHEVKASLNEIRDIRKFAITTLRNLLAKHAFDNRYNSKVRKASLSSANILSRLMTLEFDHASPFHLLWNRATVFSPPPGSAGTYSQPVPAVNHCDPREQGATGAAWQSPDDTQHG